MDNPFEGQVPEDTCDIGLGLTSLKFPGWKSRHPKTAEAGWMYFPDAVKLNGRIIPRLLSLTEMTFDDLVKAGLKGFGGGETVLAKDGNLQKLFIH